MKRLLITICAFLVSPPVQFFCAGSVAHLGYTQYKAGEMGWAFADFICAAICIYTGAKLLQDMMYYSYHRGQGDLKERAREATEELFAALARERSAPGAKQEGVTK